MRNLGLRLFADGILVGVLAGLLAVAFRLVLTEAESWRSHLMVWARRRPGGWPLVLLVFLILAAVAGRLTALAPETAGSGIPHVAAVLRRQRHLDWRRVIPVKFLAGALALGAGFSLGREGPTVQIGAAAGQAVSRAPFRPKVEERYLVACGAGAGLAATFNAPLAGVIFVLEELQRNFSPLTLGAVWAASVAADLISQYLLGPLPTFRVAGLPRLPLATLPLLVLMGAVAGVLGIAFNRCLRQALELYARFRKWPTWLHPLPPALAAGALGYYLPQVLGGGHPLAEGILGGAVAFRVIPLLFVGKFLLTMVSYGAGVPGGIFLPLLVLGALLGSFFGHLVGLVFPALSGLDVGFAAVAMAAYFTAIVRAPITGVVLVVEMTGSYKNMLALLAACLTAYMVTELARSEPVYEMLLHLEEAREGGREAGRVILRRGGTPGVAGGGSGHPDGRASG